MRTAWHGPERKKTYEPTKSALTRRPASTLRVYRVPTGPRKGHGEDERESSHMHVVRSYTRGDRIRVESDKNERKNFFRETSTARERDYVSVGDWRVHNGQ